MVVYQSEHWYNCKRVVEVYTTLHTSYYAGTTADLGIVWMGIKQGDLQAYLGCTR